MVDEVPSARLVLYADRWLQQPATLAALPMASNSVDVVVRGDSHYR
ncbi:hypothetical protein [Methylorubrum aminovorans]|nr:hypothetical protein [Methylorubrum aminovorans]